MYYIDETDFERFLKKLSGEGELFVPVRNPETGKLRLERVENFPLPEGAGFGGYRTVEPLKACAQLLRYPVAEYPSPDGDDMSDETRFPTTIVVGARGCDILAIELIDRVQIEGDFVDAFYKVRRDKMFIIGADCTECGKSCFCNLLGNKPWPEKGFELSLSKVTGGYLVEAGTDRGEKLIKESKELFREPRDQQLTMREETRATVLRELEQKNANYPRADSLPAIIREALTDEIWDDIAARCVECGACTNICPTCYCFLLYDQKADGGHFQRITAWDSCQVTGYARMAGMLNPRSRLTDRVKHRYYHKYDYLVMSHGAIYCTGCGRCIETCSAGIDMRDAFRRVTEKVGGKKA
jgi:ferredoxin